MDIQICVYVQYLLISSGWLNFLNWSLIQYQGMNNIMQSTMLESRGEVWKVIWGGIVLLIFSILMKEINDWLIIS